MKAKTIVSCVSKQLNGLLIFSLLLVCGLWCKSAFSGVQELAVEQGWHAYQQGDYRTALSTWLPYAAQGDVSVQVNLGIMYDYGLGVVEDAPKAAHWYELAAQRGSAVGQFNLAVLFSRGRGVPHNESKAAFWYRKAAEQSLDIAQFNLGMSYINGSGVQKNSSVGFYWLEQAAQQGYADAQYNLGVLLTEEKLAHGHDLELAMQWLFKAAGKYVDLGKMLQARKAVDQMRKQDPTHPLYIQSQQTVDARLNIDAPEPRDVVTTAMAVGTAWPIAQGYVVTNHHVIVDSTDIKLHTTLGQQLSAHVVMSDPQNDLAVLAVSEPSLLPPALSLAEGDSRLGSSVFTIGYPRIDVMGTDPKLTDGVISSDYGLSGDAMSYQVSVPIQPGNSGGPLLDMHGRVIGVITAMLGAVNEETGVTTVVPNVSFAVKVKALQQLLAFLPPNVHHIDKLQLQQGDLHAMADRIQSSVLLVRAY